jgi:hypothetical protein
MSMQATTHAGPPLLLGRNICRLASLIGTHCADLRLWGVRDRYHGSTYTFVQYCMAVHGGKIGCVNLSVSLTR